MIFFIIFIGAMFLPALVAGCYDALDSNHDGIDTAQVWFGTLFTTGMIPATLYVMFFC